MLKVLSIPITDIEHLYGNPCFTAGVSVSLKSCLEKKSGNIKLVKQC